MYVKKEKIAIVLDTTLTNCGQMNVHNYFDSMMMLHYKLTLEEIAKKSNYQEKDKILDDDLVRIKTIVNTIINGTAQELEKKKDILDKYDKIDFSAFDALTAATDYLYAMAMEKLGCPDIPPSFGTDVHSNIQKNAKSLDKQIKKSSFDDEYPTKTYFDNQRKKDADEVRFKTKDLIRDVKNPNVSPYQVAELVAEYQALKLRQAGHGRIWRFFHKQENMDRTELLEDMKASIVAAVGDVNLDPEVTTPSDIALLLNDKVIDRKVKEDFKPESFGQRNNCLDQIVYNQIPEHDDIFKEEVKSNVNVVENEKRSSLNIDEEVIKENNNVEVSQAVSNDSNVKNDLKIEK